MYVSSRKSAVQRHPAAPAAVTASILISLGATPPPQLWGQAVRPTPSDGPGLRCARVVRVQEPPRIVNLSGRRALHQKTIRACGGCKHRSSRHQREPRAHRIQIVSHLTYEKKEERWIPTTTSRLTPDLPQKSWLVSEALHAMACTTLLVLLY